MLRKSGLIFLKLLFFVANCMSETFNGRFLIRIKYKIKIIIIKSNEKQIKY